MPCILRILRLRSFFPLNKHLYFRLSIYRQLYAQALQYCQLCPGVKDEALLSYEGGQEIKKTKQKKKHLQSLLGTQAE